MAIPCLKPIHNQVQFSTSGARLVFSSKQIEMFRQMAQETRQSVLAAKSRKLAFSSAGVLAWFSGSSGTGKTMAAEVVARELRTSLYRVNLSQVVSKYIGETEKKIDSGH